MALRVGPGPVFWIELIAAGRRWQTFAMRALLIAILLGALITVWVNNSRYHHYDSELSLNDHAAIGSEFTNALLGTQLALVLLAAPAATAGAICIDKARGNLLMLMATQLSSREIVFGKLFACLMPVFGLIVASIPVLFMASLLGGVSWQMVLGGFVTIGCAGVLGCAVALTISLYVGKTHEALLLAYMFIIGWMLSYPIAFLLSASPFISPPPDWLLYLNPFALLYAPNNPRSGILAGDFVVYAAVTLGLSAVVSTLAAWRLRKVIIKQASQVGAKKRKQSQRSQLRSERLLSRSPMRWYERYRKRPSKATRLVWIIFTLAALSGTIWTCFALATHSRMSELGVAVNVLQVGVGLLLVTVYAVNSLADERVRGSLDVLMTTPISSRAIVWNKWRSTFALVPWLIVLPATIALAVVLCGSARSFRPSRMSPDGMMGGAILVVLHPLTCGAMLTSFGLFLATWFVKFSRAVGIAIACYVLLTIGWMFIVAMILPKNELSVFFMQASPMAAQGFLTSGLFDNESDSIIRAGQMGALVAIPLNLAFAAIFYFCTLRMFDRRMGRIPDTGLRKPKVSRSEQEV